MSSTKNNNQHKHMHTHTKDNDNDKAFAKSYLETPLANHMDDTNKNAMKIWKNDGVDAAVKHMMNSAGGDYSRMRSMFG